MLSTSKKPIGKKRVSKQNEPFDAEDLCRRLTAHIVEQKAKTEKRRESRGISMGTHEEDSRVNICNSTKYSVAPESPITQPQVRSSHEAIRVPHKGFRGVTHQKIYSKGNNKSEKYRGNDQHDTHRRIIRHHNLHKRDQALESWQDECLKGGTYHPMEHAYSKSTCDGPGASDDGEIYWQSTNRSHKMKGSSRGRRNIGWLKRGNNGGKDKGTSSPLLKRMETSWILMIKKIPKFQNFESNSPDSTDSLPSPPATKPGGRNSFLNRFLKHSSI
ncbi:unnamed protein product [Blumeria hordei]|uniref:Uncharacterized protein n=1 Tax=Blumeria hordei TaxID=2867405 RepID=A0A383UUG9_BLUHO|nr:unnamed protein product [Blumeria hordei]